VAGKLFPPKKPCPPWLLRDLRVYALDELVPKVESRLSPELRHEQLVNVVRMRAAGDPVLEQIEKVQE
jgi:hypothetical protein